MPEQEIQKTKADKTKKMMASPLEYTRWEVVVFIGVSVVLILASTILGIVLISSISQTVGGSWAKTIQYIGFGVIGFLLLLCSGLLFLFSRRSVRGIWIIWGILLASIIIGASIMLGIGSGLKSRMQADQQQRFTVAAEHFNYGIQALNQGDLAAAKIQFLYVNELVPNFPGLIDKLYEVEMQLAMALTPVATPTPEPIAVPTGGTPDDYYLLAQQAIQASDWASAFRFLEAIRNIDIHYKQTELDSAYYLVLRNLGVEQINANNLETGVYNLTLAQKFAPLDVDAARSLSWAKADIQINVWIGFAGGFIKIGNELAYANQSACDVLKAYQSARGILDQHGITDSITLRGDSEDLNTKINNWFPICYPPTATPTITPIPSITPTPTETPIVVVTTESPTMTPTT